MSKYSWIILIAVSTLLGCQSKQTPANTGDASGEKKPSETFVVDNGQAPQQPAVSDVKPPSKEAKDATTLLRRGLELIEAKKYDEGIGYLDRALETDPKNARIFFNRGFAYYSLKDYDKALTDFMQTLKINSADTMAMLYCGLAKYYKNDYQGAFQDYSNAILKSKGYYNRGIARGQMKDYKGAVEDFTKAIIIDPNYPEAYYNRGLANFFKKDSDNACIDWTRAALWGSASAQKAIDLYCKNVKVQ
jgi:tetratricopeptide (TPR) repeat protein